MGGFEATRAEGVHELLMALMDGAMSWLNDRNRCRAYRELLGWLDRNRHGRIHSRRLAGGVVASVRDPAGVLFEETWYRPPNAAFESFRRVRLYGFGSTPGAALVQGRGTGLATAPDRWEFRRYVFVDLRRMRLAGAGALQHLGVESFTRRYRLDPRAGLLEPVL